MTTKRNEVLLPVTTWMNLVNIILKLKKKVTEVYILHDSFL